MSSICLTASKISAPLFYFLVMRTYFNHVSERQLSQVNYCFVLFSNLLPACTDSAGDTIEMKLWRALPRGRDSSEGKERSLCKGF